MTTVIINESNIVTVLLVGSLALLAVLAGAGFIFGSARFSGSVVAGGCLAIGNFIWLKSVLTRSLRLEPHQAPRFALVRYIVRLSVLAAVIYVLIAYWKVDIFGLLLGLSVLVFNITGFALYLISAKGD